MNVQEGELTHDQIDESSKIAAALIVGFADGMLNLADAKRWTQGDQLEFVACVDIAKQMLWDGEPTTQLDRMRVLGLQDDLMVGPVNSDDVYDAIRANDQGEMGYWRTK